MRAWCVAAAAPLILAGCSVLLSFDDSSTGDGGDGDATGAPPDDGGGDGATCVEGAVTSSPVDPTLVVALDASGSMTSGLGASATPRFQVALDGLAARLEKRFPHVRVGALTFSGAGVAPCPESFTSPPALDAQATTLATLASAPPNGQAPLADAIAAATALGTATPPPGAAHLLILTDSPPVDCTATSNLGAAVAAAGQAAAAGLGVDIITFGTDLVDAEAAAIASAGDGTAARVLEVEQFAPTLESVLVELDACVFRPDDGAPIDATAVFVDGTMVPADGWAADGAAGVRLLGAFCTSYRSGPRRSIQVVRGCGG